MLNTKKALSSISGDVVNNKTVRVIFTNPFILSLMIVLIMLLVIILIYDAGGERAYIKTALYGYMAILGITYLSAETADCISEERYRSQIVEQVATLPVTLPQRTVTGQGEQSQPVTQILNLVQNDPLRAAPKSPPSGIALIDSVTF